MVILCQPSWWPESLEFKSPNKRPRFSVEELDKILDSCIKFLELEQQDSIDESEVGAEEIQRELNKGSKDNEGDTGNTNEVFNEVQIKNRTGSNVSAHMRKIKDDFQVSLHFEYLQYFYEFPLWFLIL